MNSVKGFTLIELIVVIVVLGILAATAAPKFVDVSRDARVAVVRSFEDDLRKASQIANGKAQLTGVNLNATNVFIDGNNDGDNTDGNGVDIRLDFGYPEATSNGIDLIISDLGGFVPQNIAGTREFRFNDTAGCSVSYADVDSAGGEPVITLDVSGC